MLARQTFLTKYPGFVEGATVYDKSGEDLGTIISLSDDYFTIQKGIFFPRDFTLRYDDIENVRDGNVYLFLNKGELEPWADESYAGWSQIDEINTGRLKPEPKPEFKDRYGTSVTEKTEVPVMEEKLEAEKRVRQVGEVAVRKLVHTELRHFTVPVLKEEVRIERTAVPERATSDTEPGAFKDTTVKVPVMEEEVTISKRPVVKEEVRVTKERRTEEQPVSAEVKREEVQIKEEGDLRKKKAG